MTYEGLDASALARLIGSPRVVLEDSVPSVLDVAHRLGAGGEESGTLVLSEEQTAGRGRSARTWQSPRGGGIWLAILLRPAAAPQAGALALRAGLATALALEECAPGLTPALKWPNDIMVGGRKAGGILCEARWSGERLGWIAVGVGLNVSGPVPESVRSSAIALADAAPALERRPVLAALVPRLAAMAGAPPALTDAERAAFLERCWMPPGSGVAVRLDPDGALWVRRSDGQLDRRVAPE